MNRSYTYKDWTYSPSEEVTEDNIKIWHDFKHADGRECHCDFTPYSFMTPEDIRLWIDLGRPGRIGAWPLDTVDLNYLWREELSK